MNRVILVGRLTKDAEVKYSTGEKQSAIARFTLAVDRKFKKDGEQSADFISCVAYGGTAQFLEKYGNKGTKFICEGRIQTGSYINKEGVKVYTTDVVIENIEFAESKNATMNDGRNFAKNESSGDGFLTVPSGNGEELPFA